MMFHPRMMRLARRVYRYLIPCVVLGLCFSGFSVWRGFLTAAVIDAVFAGTNLTALWRPLLFILLLAVAASVCAWLRRGAEMLVAAGVKRELRPVLFAKLARLGPGYVTREGGGKIQAALVDGVEALEGYFGAYVPQVLITLSVPSAILIYLFSLDVWVGLSIAVAVLTALFAPKLWDRMLGDYGQNHWNAYAALNARFVDSMHGMTTLVAFNAAERRGETLRRRAWDLYRATMRQLAVSLMNTGVLGLAMKGGSALALGVAALRATQGHLSLEELLIILFLAGECIGPLADLDRAWHAGYMGISASSGIFAVLDQNPAIETTHPKKPPAMSRPEVVFERVRFGYDHRVVLDDFSLTLKPGETTALVGASGAGKSTVAALLARFYDCEGRIRINGLDIREMTPSDLRSLIAVVSQDTYLFYGSVADNLRLAKAEADDAALKAAAKAANAHDFIMALPQGYETVIGERGEKLSGGERQRLAIARALLKDAPILILDEATASVDGANEAEIQAALARAAHSRTTLVIAHRLNTVRDADQIHVLEGGRIVESGGHETLIRHEGAYARLVTAGEVGP